MRRGFGSTCGCEDGRPLTPALSPNGGEGEKSKRRRRVQVLRRRANSAQVFLDGRPKVRRFQYKFEAYVGDKM